MPPRERRRKVVIMGLSKRAFTFESLVGEVRRGSRVGRFVEKVILFNTASRLDPEHIKRYFEIFKKEGG